MAKGITQPSESFGLKQWKPEGTCEFCASAVLAKNRRKLFKIWTTAHVG